MLTGVPSVAHRISIKSELKTSIFEKTNYLFSQCYATGTHGFPPPKLSPFGQAVWSAIGDTYIYRSEELFYIELEKSFIINLSLF